LCKRPASTTISAAEPSVILSFELSAFDQLAADNHAWCMWTRRVAETFVVYWEQRCVDFAALDSGERLRVFEERFAPLMPRLKKQVVASYLGIAPESLSRLLKVRRE
jgi:CRP-like cAMP-binding protein